MGGLLPGVDGGGLGGSVEEEGEEGGGEVHVCGLKRCLLEKLETNEAMR